MNKNKAIWLMIASAAAFSMMQICVAKTAGSIPLFEQLFFRNSVATIVAYIGIRKKKLSLWGKSENRLLLSMRSLFGFLGMMCTFYSSGNGEQGDVSTILKMSPFVITIIAFLFLGEKITKYQVTGLFVASLGAICVANPKFNTNITPILVALAGCVFIAIAYSLVSALKGREEPEVIIFFFSIFSTLATVPMAAANLTIPTVYNLFFLVLIGIFAALGQIALTYSYANWKASEVSIYNYTGIVFSMIFGYIFLGEVMKTNSLIGGGLVILAGVIVYFGNAKTKDKVGN